MNGVNNSSVGIDGASPMTSARARPPARAAARSLSICRPMQSLAARVSTAPRVASATDSRKNPVQSMPHAVRLAVADATHVLVQRETELGEGVGGGELVGRHAELFEALDTKGIDDRTAEALGVPLAEGQICILGRDIHDNLDVVVAGVLVVGAAPRHEDEKQSSDEDDRRAHYGSWRSTIAGVGRGGGSPLTRRP